MQTLDRDGYLSPAEYQSLRDAYIFLRRLVDALRVVRGHAPDLVLPQTDAEAFTFLARRLGYWSNHGTPAQLARDIKRHMSQARHIYQARFVTTTAPPLRQPEQGTTC
jgi:glutamate-ammonia-ligase adenylyltransferase